MAKPKKAKLNEAASQLPKPDPIAETLVQHGLAPKAFLLDINRALTVPRDMELPHPWNLPSRLFQFPIEITVQDKEGARKLGLRHPLLADHPFVKRVESALGIELDRDGAPNEFGYTEASHGTWWHAVDLVSAGRWPDLLETSWFTTRDDIAGAVAFGLTYSPHQEGRKRNGCISTREAREIMAAIDSPEPACGTNLVREDFMPPSPVKSDKGVESWPINRWPSDRQSSAWGHIVGIEAGWFAHNRAGFLGWTVHGRECFAAADTSPLESAALMSLADEIAPRPATKATQLSLF